MFANFLALSALAILAVANPTLNGGQSNTSGSCSTGAIQCCQSVQAANSVAASTLLATLGVVVQDVTTPMGITCSPITAVGVGGGDAW